MAFFMVALLSAIALLRSLLSLPSFVLLLDNTDDGSAMAAADAGSIAGRLAAVKKCNSKILRDIGKAGEWKQDWEFAKKYSYGMHHGRVTELGPAAQRTHGKFQPSKDAPLPWPASWRWVERLDGDDPRKYGKQWQNHSFYPVHPMTPDVMCELLISMRVYRIAFYGDSLTETQFNSFLDLFGTSYIQNLPGPNKDYTLICPKGPSSPDEGAFAGAVNSSIIEIPLFHKRDTGGQAFPHSARTKYELDDELCSFVSTSHERALAIFNIGAHYHNMTWYEEDMDSMLGSLKDINRPQDLYFFRTNVPGHPRCEPTSPRAFNWTAGTREVPYNDINEFWQELTDAKKFSWNFFPAYNEYSKAAIEKWHEWQEFESMTEGGSSKEYDPDGTADFPIMHVLDVFNMTVLRRDGHGAIGGDCLHYMNPGPVDWYNHLLYSYLRELNSILKSRGMLNCHP